jgi:hypothetical protein
VILAREIGYPKHTLTEAAGRKKMRGGNRTVQGFLSTRTTTDNRPEAGGFVEEITGGTAVFGRANLEGSRAVNNTACSVVAAVNTI